MVTCVINYQASAEVTPNNTHIFTSDSCIPLCTTVYAILVGGKRQEELKL